MQRAVNCFDLMRGSSLRARERQSPQLFSPKESQFTTNHWMRSLQFPKQPSLLWIGLLAVEKSFMSWVLSNFLRKMMIKSARFLAGRTLNEAQFRKGPASSNGNQKASQVDCRTWQTQGVPFLPMEGLSLIEEKELKAS